MRLLALPAVLSTLAFTAIAAPGKSESKKPLPLLIWHGLGDRHDADGLHSVGDLVNEIHPDTYVYYIRLNDKGDEDRKATFFGNVNDQIDQVCSTMKEQKELLDEAGIVRADALGFSQGGQFLRGLVQRCDGLRVRTLMTFGSQHNGISDVQECGTWDLLCKGAVALMRGNIWTEWVQTNVVPAQYYRTLDWETGELTEEYLEKSNFLADINNEREGKEKKNETYKSRLSALEMLALFVFEEDKTVIPRETGWFAEVNDTDSEDRHVIPLRERAVYVEDWLGLRALDEKRGLACMSTPGDHMQLDDRVMREAFDLYFGPERKSAPGPWKGKGRTDGCGFTLDGEKYAGAGQVQVPFKQGL
ncbi:Palmitoyl- thioesterase 1 [Lecanosticta acicola]|uniref:Palmitoyl-protein thioesterase 1 n=1 Tax=Lecanosticta acicola TaxID=111012 RepID=A0AAI9EDE8_9PEZI|nr:Palmitoyl- thioesterase 1 [Lecanosticta acicola]